jgi:OOP family OmpA-OmpF porin
MISISSSIVDDLVQVVRWDVGGHAHRDAGAAVDQQVGQARGQHQRLALAAVVVRAEVDRLLVDVGEHLVRDLRQADFGVAHRRGVVAVDRAEVALAVHQHVAQRERLGHAHDGLVDRGVAVRVILAHHVADDARRLLERAVPVVVLLVHREQAATMDRLQAVSCVGQGPTHDHAHRVIQIRAPHLLFEADGQCFLGKLGHGLQTDALRSRVDPGAGGIWDSTGWSVSLAHNTRRMHSRGAHQNGAPVIHRWHNDFCRWCALARRTRANVNHPDLDVSQATAAFLERRIMKKLNKVAMIVATVAIVAPMSSVFAQATTAPERIDNWRNVDGEVWKNGTRELCWRDNFWTPATAVAECDGALKPVVVAAPVEAPAPAPVAPPAPAPVVVAPVPSSEKVTYAADAFFDFDKAVLKPEAKTKLDDLVSKTKEINLEVIIAVGHTDSVGTDAYNDKLSVRRAESIKAYLTSKGLEANRVYTEGKGKRQPVADNKTAEGRAKNRRVEIEVVGTRATGK